MRIVLVTGIYPPDIGGPATHVADLAAELGERGHDVTVVTLTDDPTLERRAGLVRFPRRWHWAVRLVAVARWLVRHRGRYDLVYASGLEAAAVAGARAARRPVIVKIVGDPAWERGSRLGLTDTGFDRFQDESGGGLRLRLMRRTRDWSVRRADAVVVPGAELKPVVERWAGDAAIDVTVVPNGVRVAVPPAAARGQGGDLRAVFVGRLVDHKRVDVLIDAVAGSPAVHLDVVGDGPARPALERHARARAVDDRVTFTGPLDHSEVLRRLPGFDVLVSASSYEGLSHVAIEALVCGTPLVVSSVGGTSHVLADEENGVRVDPPTPEQFGRVLARLRDDPDLLARLTYGARASGEHWRFSTVADRVEAMCAALLQGPAKPAAVFVGKGGIPTRSTPAWDAKLTVLDRHLDATIVSPAGPGRRREHGVRLVRFPQFRPVPLASASFYVGGAVRGVLRAARREGAVVCQSPFEAAVCLAARHALPRRSRPRVVLEVHGDWATAARLYGSRARRLVAPASDWVARWAVRRADRVRAVGEFTTRLARDAGHRGEIDQFMTFSDWDRYLDPDPVAPPAEPRVVFVGALEPYKAPEVLLDAWSRVVREVPSAHLSLVGDGPMLGALMAQAAALGLDGTVEFCGAVAPEEVVHRLDGARFMVLPSRSEGVPRVVLEAMARARAVVGARAGGTPELLEDGATGLLVSPNDPEHLAAAVVALLSEPVRAREMGEEGRRRALARDPVAEYDAGTARLAAWIASS